MLNAIFGENLKGLERVLDLAWRRNQAITSNISNADTPQYRAVELNFGGELARAFGKHETPLKLSDPKHLDIEGAGNARLVEDLTGATKADGNNVDIDIQMGQLASNSGRYGQAAKLVRRNFERLSNVLRTIA
jgi:flagellar basal-body rod protein FlgB